MKACWYWLLTAAFAVSVPNCTSTSDITLVPQMRRWSGTLLVLTHDSSLYRLTTGRASDSLIIGTGTVERRDSVVPFKGGLPLSSVKYVQLREPHVVKTVLAIGATAFVGRALIDALCGFKDRGHALVETYYQPYSGGGGGGGGGGGESCPLLYAWDGAEYRLQGEGFSVAWGRALEYTSTHVLPDLVESRGRLTTRIVNNRSETHYINSVGLLAISAEKGAEVCPDTEGRFWTLQQIVPPVVAVDHSGADVGAVLAAEDDVRWRSDLRPSESGGGFEDTLLATFDRRGDSRQATFFVRAINTRISAAVFGWVGRLLGDQALRFVDRIEHDPGFAALLGEWMHAASLRIEVWNGSSWEEGGHILPEANEVLFSRIVRLVVPTSAGERIRIRLRALCDVWEIDRVGLDWSPATPLPATELHLVSAVDDRGGDQSGAIARDDSTYAVTLPPQFITLVHVAPPPGPGREWKYAMRIGGYLHEWLPDDEGEPGPLSMLTGEARVEAVRLLMMNPQLALPPVYTSWRGERGR